MFSVMLYVLELLGTVLHPFSHSAFLTLSYVVLHARGATHRHGSLEIEQPLGIKMWAVFPDFRVLRATISNELG